MDIQAWSSIVTSTSTLVVAASGGVGLIKLIGEVREREARRFEERMMEIVRNLASSEDIQKASGALSLYGMCTPRFAKYHEQLTYMLVGLLNSDGFKSDSTHRVLVKSLEALVRCRYKKNKTRQTKLDKVARLINKDKKKPRKLDLGHASIPLIDLSNVSIRKADLGFADLTGANLAYCDLYRARGIKVTLDKANLFQCNLTEARMKYAKCREAKFSKASLKSAFLEEGDFRRANFGGASLQSAHFHSARLEGATFTGSNIKETYFVGCRYDDKTLESLLKAKTDWREAHYDAAMEEDLEIAEEVQRRVDRSIEEWRQETKMMQQMVTQQED